MLKGSTFDRVIQTKIMIIKNKFSGTMKKIILFSFFVVIGITTKAQIKTGSNPTTLGNGQLLELEKSGTRAGLKVASVALTSATDVSTINIASTAVGTMVWNTATAGTAPNDVTPGFYIWNGSKWDKVTTASSVSSTPGYVIPSGNGTNGIMIIESSYIYPNTQLFGRSEKFELTSLTDIPMNTIGGTISNDNTNGDYITLPAGFYQVSVKHRFSASTPVLHSWVDITTESTSGGTIGVLRKIYKNSSANSNDPLHLFNELDDVFELTTPRRVRFYPTLAGQSGCNDNPNCTWSIGFPTMPITTTPPPYNLQIILKKLY